MENTILYARRPAMVVPDPTGVFNGLYNPNVLSSQPAAANLANALSGVKGELSQNLFPGTSGEWFISFLYYNHPDAYHKAVKHYGLNYSIQYCDLPKNRTIQNSLINLR